MAKHSRACLLARVLARRFDRPSRLLHSPCKSRREPEREHGPVDLHQRLEATHSIDVLELGRYVAWPKTDPLASVDQKGRAQVIQPDGTETWDPRLPITTGTDCQGARMLVATVRRREEKGSDVNVATHLMHDVLTSAVEAAIVISNDSDLSLPLRMARTRVPVGTVNPGTNFRAGALGGKPSDGVGNHWWRNLLSDDFRSHQLPNRIGQTIHKPIGW